jgi:hypothetical protein
MFLSFLDLKKPREGVTLLAFILGPVSMVANRNIPMNWEKRKRNKRRSECEKNWETVGRNKRRNCLFSDAKYRKV